jgi:hypothetical protein
MSDDSLPTSESPVSSPQLPAPIFRRVLLGVAAGLALGMLVMLGVAIMNRGAVSPRLTPDIFEAAKAKWNLEQPQNYNIEIQVHGTQPATYYVEVRGGAAQLALRNGQPLRQMRTFSTWSVPGMFATMSRDVDALKLRAAGRGDKFTPDLNLRATFDPRYGYPARYRRLQYQSSVEVEWEVTRFEDLDKPKGATD